MNDPGGGCRRPYAGIGRLELVETYEFYDEPVLYACRDSTDRMYLALLAADEADRKTWLYAPLSKRRYEQVRSGGVDLYDAFKSVEGHYLLRVVEPRPESSPEVEWVLATSVGDDMVPIPGELLDLDTGTLPSRAENATSRKIA